MSTTGSQKKLSSTGDQKDLSISAVESSGIGTPFEAAIPDGSFVTEGTGLNFVTEGSGIFIIKES